MTSANVSVEFFFRTFFSLLSIFNFVSLVFIIVQFCFVLTFFIFWSSSSLALSKARLFSSCFLRDFFGCFLFVCFLIHYAIKQCCNQDSSWVCHRAGALSHLLGCRFSFRGCRGCRGGCRCGCGGCRKRVTICKCHHLFIIHWHTNTLKWKKS